MEERQFKGIWIPKEIWVSNELSLQEKVVLVEIESLEDEIDGCFASNSYFANFFHITPSRVSQIINLLAKKEYLDIEYIKDGKEIKKRVLRIKRPPYPEVFNKLNRGIKFPKEGYLENCEDNNIYINNIKENNISNDILKEIIEYLNIKTNKNYKWQSKDTQKHIKARLNEGYTIDDFKKVIDIKSNNWLDTNMEEYLRPSTLFGSKFESYLNEKLKAKPKDLNKWAIEYDKSEREEINEK